MYDVGNKLANPQSPCILQRRSLGLCVLEDIYNTFRVACFVFHMDMWPSVAKEAA